MTDTDPRCAKCGHKRSQHHYRHPFVGQSTQATIDNQAARIEHLEMDVEHLTQFLVDAKEALATAREDALRDVEAICDNDYSLSCPSCAAVRANISALISEAPDTPKGETP